MSHALHFPHSKRMNSPFKGGYFSRCSLFPSIVCEIISLHPSQLVKIYGPVKCTTLKDLLFPCGNFLLVVTSGFVLKTCPYHLKEQRFMCSLPFNVHWTGFWS